VEVRFRVESFGGAARLTQTADVQFKSFLRMAALILRPAFRKKITAQARTEFLRLKDLCESENRTFSPRI
jgi:hypothetical protein